MPFPVGTDPVDISSFFFFLFNFIHCFTYYWNNSFSNQAYKTVNFGVPISIITQLVLNI